MSHRVIIVGEIYWAEPGRPDNTLPTPPAYPDQGLPGQPVYPSQGPGFPTHPIAPGGQPPRPWDPHFPTHPIAPGGQPPYPSQGLPPFATQLPVFPVDPTVPPTDPPVPTHPIAIGQHFVVKYSPMYGFVLVPVDDATTPEPKV